MRRVLGLVLGTLLCACATGGTRYSEVSAKLAPPGEGSGRIVVYRPAGAEPMLHPDVYLDPGNEVVGNSQAKSFFVVDRPAGEYRFWTHTDWEKSSVTFTLAPGETRFIRTRMAGGMVLPRPALELVDRAEAEEEIRYCSFTRLATPEPEPAGPAKP